MSARWRLRRRACAAMLLATLVCPAAARPVGAPSLSGIVAAAQIEVAVAEASRRFGIPSDWIRRVIRAESGGNAVAVSRAGAIGLMQLMPPTYGELRLRYGLGSDPFAVRDNIMAGTAYLRELYDRYGARGMLAAYNAGPGRWEQHVRTGRPLPEETRLYLARLAPDIGIADATVPSTGDFVAVESPPNVSIFVALRAEVGRSAAPSHAPPTSASPSLDTLFVRRPTRVRDATVVPSAHYTAASRSSVTIPTGDDDQASNASATPPAHSLFIQRRSSSPTR